MANKEELDNMGLTVLAQVRKGEVVSEFSATLREVVDRVKQTGSKGSVTVTLYITPKDRDAEQVDVEVEVACKKPKIKLGSSIFYTTEEHGLSRDDPHREDMLFKATAYDDKNREVGWEAKSQA